MQNNSSRFNTKLTRPIVKSVFIYYQMQRFIFINSINCSTNTISNGLLINVTNSSCFNRLQLCCHKDRNISRLEMNGIYTNTHGLITQSLCLCSELAEDQMKLIAWFSLHIPLFADRRKVFHSYRCLILIGLNIFGFLET